MDANIKIEGLDEALRALGAAFPKDPKAQRRLLAAGMRKSAANSIVPYAKLYALSGDGSGALSESIGVRTQSLRKSLTKGMAAGVEVVPIRSNRTAMAMYISHYYTARGKSAPAKMVLSGIRHGHLIEFGTIDQPAWPFLWPAAQSGKSEYVKYFSSDLRNKIEAAVRRRAKKSKSLKR